jgi:hypothetical protein
MTMRDMETGYWEIRNWELNYQYPIFELDTVPLFH